ncbi:MAG TPA: RNA-binding protein S4 [Rhodospirillaceae bacterium]|nr:RNA-binding protein S4 [Rhodospirillaceae bacterium]HAA92100.1 RNA-binding protein S4 [Rhodospirillaceae bacterium]HAT36234.1 RNA-binding protein S4 [Rhodospirillaceae bacterium]|tara:strand:+ start:105 stop:512 length:408 start_codon:yes stop_codon:yes gene_type:complete
MTADTTVGEKLRVDKWLWHARFFKSRTLAAKQIAAGKFRINRQVIKKPRAEVRAGDVLTFPQGPHIRVIEVIALGSRRGPATEARTLYEDLDPPGEKKSSPTPPPVAPRDPGAGRPTKKHRRAIDRLKAWLRFGE